MNTSVRHLYWSDAVEDFVERVEDKQVSYNSTNSSQNESSLSNQSILHTDHFGEITLPLSDLELEQLRQKMCASKLEICKRNCSIVQNLVELDEIKRASDCLQELIAPLFVSNGLEDMDALIEYTYDLLNSEHSRKGSSVSNFPPINTRLVEFFFNLAKTLVLFNDRLNYLRVLINLITESLRPHDLKELLKVMREHGHHFQNSDELPNLFEHRLNWLKQQVKSEPVFQWAMPDACLSGHPQVTEFLRSSSQVELDYAGGFASKSDALHFVDYYTGLKETYSVEMQVHCTRQGVIVNIQKTSAYYEFKMKQYAENVEELNSFVFFY